jgi:hypothetical protein
MASILALTKRFLTAWRVAQVLSAGIVFYGGGIVLALFMRRETAAIPFILFTLLVPASFAALTVGWYKLCWRKSGIPRPEVNLIIGSVILMPLYFEVTSLFIYKPRPIIPRDIAEDLFWYYVMLPITVTLMGAYTATLGALILALASTLVTGELMRRRGLKRGLSCHS